MATSIYNIDGTDLDDIYEKAPSAYYSASEFIRRNGVPDLNIKASNNGYEVMGSDGQCIFDRYLHISYSNVHAHSKNAGEFVSQFNSLDAQGRQTTSVADHVDAYEVFAKKGSAGAPTFSPSSGSFSNSRHVNNSEFDSTQFTVTQRKEASGNPSPTSYSIYSYTISGGSNNSVMIYDGAPTISSSGLLYINIDAAGDSFYAGSDTYTLTIKVQAHNVFGASNIYTHTLSQTITWDDLGDGGEF